MRRADRLFEIIEMLRRKRVTRAQDLADKLEVSERTIYRDIQDLIASGVPIEGEAGVGYMLRSGYDLPPLMFSETEIEALILGARIIESSGDRALSDAASGVIAKVEAVVPAALREYMACTALLAPASTLTRPIAFDVGELRKALRDKCVVAFSYTDGIGEASARTVRPLSLAYFGPVWCLAAWCELRDDFRVFRLDRIADFKVEDRTFKTEAGKTLKEFLARDRTWFRGKCQPDTGYLIGGPSTATALPCSEPETASTCDVDQA
ncbi:MAG: YafY family protein [Pseudomonadota bacterium]